MASLDPPNTPPPDSNLYKLRRKNAVESLKDAADSSTEPDAGAPSAEPDATASLTESDAGRLSHEEQDTAQWTKEDWDKYYDWRNELNPSPEYREYMYVSKEEWTLEELKIAMKPFNGGGVEVLPNKYKPYAQERFRIVHKDGTFGPGTGWSKPGRTDHRVPRRYREDVLNNKGFRV